MLEQSVSVAGSLCEIIFSLAHKIFGSPIGELDHGTSFELTPLVEHATEYLARMVPPGIKENNRLVTRFNVCGCRIDAGGCTPQKPERRAVERDEKGIERFIKVEWKKIVKEAGKRMPP